MSLTGRGNDARAYCSSLRRLVASYLLSRGTNCRVSIFSPINRGVAHRLREWLPNSSGHAALERACWALDNPVLRAEERVTMVDGFLATAVLAALVVNASLGWWWADPVAGYVILVYGVREGWATLRR